jgi:hypothetical protein
MTLLLPNPLRVIGDLADLPMGFSAMYHFCLPALPPCTIIVIFCTWRGLRRAEIVHGLEWPRQKRTWRGSRGTENRARQVGFLTEWYK